MILFFNNQKYRYKSYAKIHAEVLFDGHNGLQPVVADICRLRGIFGTTTQGEIQGGWQDGQSEAD